jgi:hypothetical protein
MATATLVNAAIFAARVTADFDYATEDMQSDHLMLLQKRASVKMHMVSNVTGHYDVAGDIYQRTELNAEGGGNIVYLDRHNVQCPSGTVMSQWRLGRDAPRSLININYGCSSISTELGSCSSQETVLNADGGGNSVYLDRHNVACNRHGVTNRVMTEWKLSRAGTNDKMQVLYQCCDVPTGLDSCEDMETPLNDDGGGNSVYFDRHNVKCPANKVMTQWYLSRAGTHNKIQFKYQCCSVKPPEAGCFAQSTQFNQVGDGNVVYLDRHDAVCPSGTMMSQWRLGRNAGHTQIDINYNCCASAAPLGSCSNEETVLNADGGGNSVYLDRHNIACNRHGVTNSVMTQWRLSRAGTNNKMQVLYTCCDVPTGLDSCENKETPLNEDGGGNVVYFDRHNANCGVDKVMTQWYLSRAGTHNKIQFKYQCCSVNPPTTTTTTTTTIASVQGLDDNEREVEIQDQQAGWTECRDWCYKPKHAAKKWKEGKNNKCGWKACSICPECDA